MVVHLIAGPPCSGKSTYVADHAGPDDIVLDLDVIARGLGSPHEWMHDEHHLRAADRMMRDHIANLAGDVDAWVIRCLPSAHERAALAHHLDADLVVLDPGQAECLRRAAARPSGTRKAIRLWYWRAHRG